MTYVFLFGRNGKTAMGWRTSGKQWDGHSIKRIDEVIAWKKVDEVIAWKKAKEM